MVGKNGQPLKGSILTYFMSIARNKYREYLRDHPLTSDTDLEQTSATDGCIPTDVPDFQGLYDASDNTMIDIIAEVIANMSPKCYEILTKFYYEEKNLEVILSEIDSIESKDALKTKKYKCMETLRRTAHDMYQNFLRTE